MSSTDDPYSPTYGTATFTDTRADSPSSSQDYTDSNSLEEVEASLNDLDDDIDDTQNAVSNWSSSYTGSPSFVSLPTFASPPPPVRLSRITERTEDSRPSSMAARPAPTTPDFRRSMHSRASTEPGLPPPGRATELIAVFEAAPVAVTSTGHARGVSTPSGVRSPSPFFTPAHSVSDVSSYAQGFHSTFGSRPASPTKSGRVTSPSGTSSTPSRTRPSMGTLLSQGPLSTTSGYTGTRTDTFTGTTNTNTNTFSPPNTNTFTPSNTNTYTYTTTTNTQTPTQSHAPTTPPASLRRPAQGSPRSPLASVRNIVALWKERTPARKSPSASSSSSKTSSASKPKSKSENADDDAHPLPALPTSATDPDEGLFGIRRTASQRSASLRSASMRRGSAGSGSASMPPTLNVAELSAYAQSNEPPLHIGLLWFLNVHAAPPYRWQRCQALLYPHLLLLSWLAPGGGRGLVGLDLVHCTAVQSMPSPGHPGARDDVGSIAARVQSDSGEPGVDTLVDLLVPFQMVYEDGVERLAAESLLERQKWVNRIWEAVHRPPRAESSAGSSGGDADESASESNKSRLARSESIRTILSVDSAESVGSRGSAGSRSTVFVPPVADIPDMGSEGRGSTTSSSGGYSGAPSEAWRRAYSRTGTGTWTPTETRTEAWTPTGTGTETRGRTGSGTWTPSEYTRTFTPTATDTRTYTSETQTRTGASDVTRTDDYTRTGTGTDFTRTETLTDTATTTTGVRRRASLVSSHHTGTVDDSVIDRGAYVYPGDPRAIGRRGPGLGARRGSMGELDERASVSGDGSGEDVFLSAESGSTSGSGRSSRTGVYGENAQLKVLTWKTGGTGTNSSGSATRRSGTLYSQSVGLRTGAFSSAAPSGTFSLSPSAFTGSPTRTGSLSYRGSVSLLGDSHSDYSASASGSDTYSSYSYTSPSRTGTGTSLARAREVRRRPGLGLGLGLGSGGRTSSSGYTYSGSASDSYSRTASESEEDKENSSTEGEGGTGPPSDSNGNGSGTGSGSGFTPGTYSTNQTGYDICPSSDLSDVTTRTTSGYTPLSSSPPSSSPPSSSSSSPPPSSSGSSDRFITASQGSSSSSEYTTAPRAPSSSAHSSYASFPTIPSESAYQTAPEPSDMGDIPSEMGTPRPAPSVLPSEDDDEKRSLIRVPSLVPTIRSESSVEYYPPLPPSTVISEQYPPLPPSSVASEQYPALPPSSVASESYPVLPPSSVSSEQYPPLPSTVSSEQYPPLPSSTVSSEHHPPLPPSSVSSSSVSAVSSLSFSTESSPLPYLAPATPYESSEESSDVQTPMSLAFSSASSASVSGPSPIESQAGPSTLYEPPSAISRSMTETSLTSSSNLTPLSRALSSLRSWASASSGTYESSVLAPSPTVGSIALHDPPDTSGETSFLRPTESFSSWDRLSTIPRSEQSLTPPPPPPPSSSLSDVSTPSGLDFPSDSSSSLGRTLSVLTQSSLVSDSSSDAGSLPESPLYEEPVTTPLLSTPRSTPRPSRPPSSVASSTRSLRTPEDSGSVSVSTPRGNVPSMRSVLETVPSYRAPSTHGVTLEHLADELRRLADLRGEENHDIADNVRALRNELRDLANFLQRPASRAAAAAAIPLPPSPVPPMPSPAQASPTIRLLEPPMSYVSLSRSSSTVSSISFLSSHYSDDDLVSLPGSPYPLPGSPYPPEARDFEVSTPDYPASSSYAYSTTTPLPSSSSESSSHPYPPPSPSPSSPSSSPTSSSSASTVRPANYLPILEGIRGTVDGLANSAATYGPILQSIRELVDGLWQAQISTNHSLDRLREREREPPVAPDPELSDRMRRIEDLLQHIIDQPREAPQPPIIIPPPHEPSDSGSESSFWPSLLQMRDVPDIQVPIPAPPPGRSFAQQLDDLLSSAGTGVPLEPAERPPAVVPFSYDVQSRGLRPRSGVGITVPAGPAPRPPPRPDTEPPRREGILRHPRIPPQDLRDIREHGFLPSSRPGPSEPETFPAPPGQPTRPFVHRPVAPPVRPVDLSRLHEPGRAPTAPGALGGDDEPRPSWYTPAQRPGPSAQPPPVRPVAGPGPPPTFIQPGPAIVQLPPVFDSLMEILRENRLAQLATVDQQRELMRYMRGLNEWLERDVHDRHAELQGVVARVDQLREEMRRVPAQGPPGPDRGSDSSSSDGGDGPPIVIPGQQDQRPVIPPLGFQPYPRGYAPVIPPVVPGDGRVVPGDGREPPFIPQFPNIPVIPQGLPPPGPVLWQPQGPGPAPFIPGMMGGPGPFMPMPQPQFQQGEQPFIPQFGPDRSPMYDVDPAVIPIPVSRPSSSSSSEGPPPRRHRRRSRSGSVRSGSSGSSERPILVQQPMQPMGTQYAPTPMVVAPTGSEYQQQQPQAPPPQTIVIQQPPQQPQQPMGPSMGSGFQPTYMPQPSVPIVVAPSRGRSRSRSRSRSPRSSRRSPIIIQASRPSRSRSSRSSRRGRRSRSRSRSPERITVVQPPQTGFPPTMYTPTGAPILVHSPRSSRSSRSRHRTPQQAIIVPPTQPAYTGPQTQAPPVVIQGDSGRRTPIVMSRRSRSRSRSHSPRYYAEHPSYRRRSRSRSRSGHDATVIIPPTTTPHIITHSRRSRSRSRSPIYVEGSRRSRSRRSRSRSRSPRHYPTSHGPPIVVAGTHRTHRSRSRSRSPSYHSSRHPSRHPSAPPIVVVPSGTHRPRSRSPTYIAPRSRSRSRSPRHYPDYPGYAGTHRTPRTHRSRSRSRSRSPRHYPDYPGYVDTHRTGTHRAPGTHYSDASRSRSPREGGRRRRSRERRPGRSRSPPSDRSLSPRPGRHDTERESDAPRPTHVVTVPGVHSARSARSARPPTPLDYAEHEVPELRHPSTRHPTEGRYSPVPSMRDPVRVPLVSRHPTEGGRLPARTVYEGDRPAPSEEDRSAPDEAGRLPAGTVGLPREEPYDDGHPIPPPGGIPSHYEPEEGVSTTPSGRVHPPGPSEAPGVPPEHRVPVPTSSRSVYGDQAIPSGPSEQPVPPPGPSVYGDQPVYGEPGVPFSQPTGEPIRPLPGRPISPGRYSPRPTVTPFPVDLAQADAERERLERLADVENRLQEVAVNAQDAEDQRERDFRKNEEDRERIFMESEERRAHEARERQDAIWRDMEGLGAPPPRPPGEAGDGASVHSVQAATEEAASILASSIKDTVQAEREQFAREREEMAAERARLEAERDAARDALMGEKEARVRALEEELATLRGELENERQLRSTDNTEAQERERQALTDTSETRAQLGDITNLIQDQREACERKKELMEERWKEKQDRRQDKEFKWIELRDMVQKIHDDMEADRVKAEEKRLADESKPAIEKIIEDLTRQNAEQRELLNSLSDSWRADSNRQHEETIAAIRSTAQEQVRFNVQGYLDDFSKALASEVRMLLGEVGKLREERRALQHELGYLLCMKSKYGPGGEFEPDWKPPPGAPGGPPLDPPPPPPPPELPQARPGWRTVRPTTARKPKKKDAAPPPPPTAAPAPDPRRQVQSWATWQPDPNLQPTPTSVEATLLVPDSSSPGLFGPRSPRGSRYGG
ncbi:hypothetical protein DFH07DRAFT_942325 [Mycena maculata]|uniref:PH domain-containing protein n=1 Tax=Mycena maculata TaxID=230809 RepID=A0AAD7ISH0_9AGAR|nr:hypothetical protein DFH07DRAFT_942325 [Mycena maculata]